MPNQFESAARNAVWVALVVGAVTSTVMLFSIVREVEGGFGDEHVQSICKSLSLIYLPPLSQVGVYYWAKAGPRTPSASLEWGGLIFTLVLVVAYAFTAPVVVSVVAYVEDIDLVLGSWYRVAGLTLISGAVAFFFAPRREGANQ